MTSTPRLSLGMPVYNGETFIRETLDSILGQSFADFALIICDNASTDATQEICDEYQCRDARITYLRNQKNIGAGPNYRRAFHSCPETEFFKWAAHDDPYDPSYLERCIARLDDDEDAVLCHSRTASIDSDFEVVNRWPARPDLASDDPLTRLRDVLRHRDTYCIWGVVRRAALASTPLLGDYPAHDRPLLAELSLHGRMHELDEFLFFDREHPNRSVRAYDAADPHFAAIWYNPGNRGKLMFPEWRLLWEYARAIHRAPVSAATKRACYGAILGWSREHRPELIRDIRIGAERLPLAGPLIASAHRRRAARLWTERTRAAAAEISGHCGAGDRVLLVDAGEVDTREFAEVPTLPFMGSGDSYEGLPASDAEAFEALERGAAEGATLVGFLWPTFWWWDHYHEFTGFVEERLSCLARSENIALYRLDHGDA